MMALRLLLAIQYKQSLCRAASPGNPVMDNVPQLSPWAGAPKFKARKSPEKHRVFRGLS